MENFSLLNPELAKDKYCREIRAAVDVIYRHWYFDKSHDAPKFCRDKHTFSDVLPTIWFMRLAALLALQQEPQKSPDWAKWITDTDRDVPAYFALYFYNGERSYCEKGGLALQHHFADRIEHDLEKELHLIYRVEK